jgi:hypothetical protein
MGKRSNQSGGFPEVRLSQRPRVLYEASLERLEESEALFARGSWGMAMYAAGVGVEALFQGFAHRAGARHDARHDLRAWLAKCPEALIDAVMRSASAEWWMLNAYWDNTLRYLSQSAVLGRLRSLQGGRLVIGLKGGPDALLRTSARRCLNAARIVHGKGVNQWPAI